MDEKQVHSLQDIIPWEKIRSFVDTHTKNKIPEDEVKQAAQTLSGLNQYQIAALLRDQDAHCTRCGECCRRCTPIAVTKQEMKQIAKHLDTPYKKMKKRLHLKHVETGLYELRGKPCPLFREPDTCTVYNIRPQSCRLYPLGRFALEQCATGIMRLPSDCPAIEDMLLHQLLAQIVYEKAVREGVLPENPPAEALETLLNRSGFSLTRDPIKQVLVSKIVQTTRRQR